MTRDIHPGATVTARMDGPSEFFRPDCVIVAAGASSRMGKWKLLLPFGSATVVETTVANARAAGLRVVLVVGYRGEELVRLFSGDPLVVPVRNEDWERGMLGSVFRGLEASSGGTTFLMNGDMPLVEPRVYGLLRQEAERRRDSGLPEVPLFAAYRGERGHPVLVPRHATLAKASSGASKMRELLEDMLPAVVECRDEAVLLDIDTPEDYERLLLRSVSR